MKPAPFLYLRPQSLDETLELLAQHGEDGKVLAGGQSLAPAMNFRLARPGIIIDINGLGDLDALMAADDGLHIGALVRHAAFHKPVVASALGRLLSLVVRHIAHYPIRQRGTFAGSLAHADPAAEWALVSTVLDAEISIAAKASVRKLAAKDFFRGSFTTALRADEVLTEIRLPLLGPTWHCGFFEFSRRAGDFALAMSLVCLRVENGVIVESRLGVGGVADRPLRLPRLEAQMIGMPPTPTVFADIAEAARASISPTADIHATAPYRRDLIRTVVSRALAQAAA